MKSTKITVCIDLLFCLVLLPAIIMLVPVDKWYAHNAWFLVTFVAYLYLLYFIYRKSNIPSLIMQRRYAKVAAVVAVLVFLTILPYSIWPRVSEYGGRRCGFSSS